MSNLQSGFGETARGLPCLRFMSLPGQPPRPAAFAPFFMGDLRVPRPFWADY